MNHQEFVEAYKAGKVSYFMAQPIAEAEISRRLWLPLIKLPVIGIGVALAILSIAHSSMLLLVLGVLIFIIGVAAPRLIKKNAIPSLLYMALHDPSAYEDLRQSGVLEVYEEGS
ncbi:MAG TPA: hypothetical protein VK001_13490 [Geminicoccaceae bacterium]|nr:hypothetical protein [Geminicoccaceae bacterium]